MSVIFDLCRVFLLSQALNVEIDLLRPNPFNPNIFSPENEKRLDNALKKFGFFKPIVVRELAKNTYEIIGGEHRWQSAKRLGFKEVPIFNLGVISDEKAKAICIADNARYGADDTIMLARMLEEIGSPEDIQSYLPYSETDLQGLFSSLDIALDDLELDDEFSSEPPEKTEKTAKTHTIMRFKVSLADAERITAEITRCQKREGFSGADELTNAGDALVHLLVRRD